MHSIIPDISVNSLLDKFVDIKLKRNPFTAAIFGIRRYEDKIWDLSYEGAVSNRNELLAFRDEITAFRVVNSDALSVTENADLDFLLESIEGNLARIGIPGEQGYQLELSNNHMFSPFVGLEMSFENYQRKETREDMENFRTRLQLLEPQFDHMIKNFKLGLSRKITLNHDGIEILIKKFAASAGIISETIATSFEETTEKARESPLNSSERARELTGDADFLVPAIRDIVMPGFAKAKKFLEDEYLPHTRQHAGIYGLPDYDREYLNYIFTNTNITYSAAEIHAIGLAEVDRINLLMEEAKNNCGYAGTLREFQNDINDREKFSDLYYNDLDKVLPDYANICREARKRMEKYFDKFPAFECNVAPIPEFLEQSLPLAMYSAGTPARGGKFLANMRLHKIKPCHQKIAICLHEANPGHHHQISLALENKNLHLARRMETQTSYAEGWGLYSEYLGEEMGFYTDPFQYFGRLETEMWRALRLAVDSGLHSKGWSIEYSVDYMLSKLSLSRDEVETEVRRYCVIPGQALSYKVGELKFKELRKFAEGELGEHFDIRKFHAACIDSGSLPLGTLEKVVKGWVASEAEGPGGGGIHSPANTGSVDSAASSSSSFIPPNNADKKPELLEFKYSIFAYWVVCCMCCEGDDAR
ncbi:hypothetical protein HK100_001131 [Physocladia obscura]|uniref:DUF885 domain-containing protein n=1 Tax=Physocladia obscura TaxID=109957 RepID=A0AAD5SX85_9FUNG|nr:hypothetical protein HK100_001131 [Physocladia obscura]